MCLFLFLIATAFVTKASLPAPMAPAKEGQCLKGIKVSQVVTFPKGSFNQVNERKLTVKRWMQVPAGNYIVNTPVQNQTQNRLSDYFSNPVLSTWQTVLISSAIFLIVALVVLVCTPVSFKV